ncbi:WYL domain-containing protein [Paenibacillus sp. CGMCC 1.16610]|uniref:WYL domain-containing protein n=1 Tax=Paenibacillus anseongense TaxID=2682845 RepID=A0ABW9UFU0_9BACL|nr:WYL domain-containing protein [Paenibacillus sp. CGMCC 1.16610]MBA2944158.1 WYL domain-containing protein [Paenibacillus sp. CGMCC 1.16610]MVQ38048.1 WYL domain-containing protein [Paenibacillus anseongense]
MARESFDKEVQFLRMFVLTSGAYSRQQFAERLGISVHTFDKTLRRLKEIIATMYQQAPDAQQKEFADMLRYSYFDSTEPMLLFLFRAKSLKESESHRIAALLAALNEGPLTAIELLDACSKGIPNEGALPDEKTIRNDLKYLEEVGVIMKTSGSRPYRYRIHNAFIDELSQDELIDLYDFIDVMSNTQVPSVQGYLLRDGLKKHMNRNSAELTAVEPFLYKYQYYSRILDEAHLSGLLSAITQRRKVQFLYFSPKAGQSYSSKNTNPLFEREMEGKLQKALPLQIVYDHQYGRWYLLAHDSRHGIRKFRVEGMTQIEHDEPVDPSFFTEKKQDLEERIKLSWVIDTGNAVTVKVRFFNPGRTGPNFIKERVLLQGQWGEITEEQGDSFVYEITVNGTTEIKPWIRSFGSSCEVLEPSEFRQEMIAEWKELSGYYEPVRENI